MAFSVNIWGIFVLFFLLVWVYFQKDQLTHLVRIFPFGFCHFSSYGWNWCLFFLLKMSFEESFFSRTVLPVFFFFWICVICLLTCYSWVLFLKSKVVHCVIDWYVLCLEVACWYFSNTSEFLQIEPACSDFVLSLQPLELVETKNSMNWHSFRFSSRVLNLSSSKV